MTSMPMRLPHAGQAKEAVLGQMRALRHHDVRWRQGRAFSLVFHAGD